MEGYKIKIQQFEGPFDLLLFFIERDELDIHDIDVSKITDDFLAYIRDLEDLNIDVASEFILVAATLMRIKAKMLIPRKELDEDGNEIDPRDELVQKLLEYQRYKDIIDELKSLEELRSLKHHRGYTKEELKQLATKALVDIELESLSLSKLFKAFEAVISRYENRIERVVHQIIQYPYTIKTQRKKIHNSIFKYDKCSFEQMFSVLENRIEAIVTFLALLELLSTQTLKLTAGLGANNFMIERGENYSIKEVEDEIEKVSEELPNELTEKRVE